MHLQEHLAGTLPVPVPVVWWIEEADLGYRGIRPVKSSRKARFRFVP